MRLILLLTLLPNQNPEPKWIEAEVNGCENVFALEGDVYSGGEPHTEYAIRALAARGIKTIVSVDGARPDIELAEKYGIRYIHLPIGYDDVPRERALQMGRVVKGVAGPIYFHCHHGKHRGPAAVAAGMAAAGKWTSDEAVDFLKAAGASEKYSGLYDVFRNK